MNSTASGSDPDRSVALRSNARTCAPPPASAATTWQPMKPAAPVTSALIAATARRRRDRAVPRAIRKPKRAIARGTRSAAATTVLQGVGEAADLVFLDQQRRQRLDHVHAVTGHLAQDLVLVKQRHRDQLREQAGLGALDRIEQRAPGASRGRAQARSPTSDRGPARRAPPRDARSAAVVSSSSSAPIRSAWATTPSRSSTRSVASAAAAARSLPPNVEPWRTARSIPSNTRSNASRETSTAPIGTKPARQRLGQADHVRGELPVLERQESPGAPEAGLDLVADEQRPALATQPLRRGAGSRRAEGARPCPEPARRSARPRRRAPAPARARRRRRTRPRSQPGSSGPKPARNSSLPLSDRATQREPVERVIGIQQRAAGRSPHERSSSPPPPPRCQCSPAPSPRRCPERARATARPGRR